ncbi:hypothetical protein CsSME_00033038 [Camellia sinensis var. sinensis]|uniref:uncharacterized protein LOC114279678 n=1 Tax=Camellia sinensis TaxID=4442 RepID=UPI00103658DF|nr:uncharacterized protein LOC114279678 [Camellia sinensis]
MSCCPSGLYRRVQIMKILLPILLTFMLILGTLAEKPSDKNLGRKVNVGANDKVAINGNKDVEAIAESKASTNAEDDDSDDEVNHSYGKLGQGAGGSTVDTHHYFTSVQRPDHE